MQDIWTDTHGKVTRTRTSWLWLWFLSKPFMLAPGFRLDFFFCRFWNARLAFCSSSAMYFSNLLTSAFVLAASSISQTSSSVRGFLKPFRTVLEQEWATGWGPAEGGQRWPPLCLCQNHPVPGWRDRRMGLLPYPATQAPSPGRSRALEG